MSGFGQPAQQSTVMDASRNTQAFRPNSDPFAPTNNINIFDAAAQRGQATTDPNQQPTNMPDGMQQQPPMNPVDMQQQQAAQQQDSMGTGAVDTNGGASPLDAFSPKSDTNPNGGDVATSPQQSTPQQPASIFDSTVKDYSLLAAKQNYAEALTPEVMQQVMTGDVNALAGLLNNVGRMAFSQAAFASSQVAKTGINQQLDSFQSGRLPELLKDNNFQQAFQSNNHEVLSHPAVAPLVEQQTQVLRNQYPNATPQEIHAKVVEYFNAVAGAFTNMPQQAAGANADTGVEQAPTGTDLEQLFSM